MKKKNSLFLIFSYICLVLIIGTALSGCQTLKKMAETNRSFSNTTTEQSSSNLSTYPVKQKRIIYIQSFSGQNIELFQNIFYKSLQEQGAFRITELLPDSFRDLGILRIKVLNYSIWENQEPVSKKTIDNLEEKAEFIVRRNALISIQVSLFEAETGKVIIKRKFSQPFQQVYFDRSSQKNRPDKKEELARLTSTLIQRIVTAILSSGKEEKFLFEKGIGHSLFAENILNRGNSRIKKGVRQAQNGLFEKALLTWKLVIFDPDESPLDKLYLINKASAFYNIGAVHASQKRWLKAAENFSKANRLNPKMRYAQAWGTSMHNWILAKENRPKRKERVNVITKVAKKRFKALKKKKDVIQVEENKQLLLKPQFLWPLDPHVKTKFSEVSEQKSYNSGPNGEPAERLNIQPVDLSE